MTAATWPAELPQSFLHGSMNEEGADDLIASSVSTGPDKLRRRTTASPYPLSGALYMDAVQFTAFRTFVDDTISGRSAPFYFPNPDGGALLLVRMTSPHKRSAMGIGWRVEIELEVLP